MAAVDGAAEDSAGVVAGAPVGIDAGGGGAAGGGIWLEPRAAGAAGGVAAQGPGDVARDMLYGGLIAGPGATRDPPPRRLAPPLSGPAPSPGPRPAIRPGPAPPAARPSPLSASRAALEATRAARVACCARLITSTWSSAGDRARLLGEEVGWARGTTDVLPGMLECRLSKRGILRTWLRTLAFCPAREGGPRLPWSPPTSGRARHPTCADRGHRHQRVQLKGSMAMQALAVSRAARLQRPFPRHSGSPL